MKLMALTIAGALTASAMTPTAALAHPGHGPGRGHHDRWDRGGPHRDHGRHHGWDRDRRHWDERRYWDDRRHWNDRRWDRGGRHWGDRRWYRGARYRTICRWRPGPYGDVRVCQRVRR
jgi:hypothetical protein